MDYDIKTFRKLYKKLPTPMVRLKLKHIGNCEYELAKFCDGEIKAGRLIPQEIFKKFQGLVYDIETRYPYYMPPED